MLIDELGYVLDALLDVGLDLQGSLVPGFEVDE
jgi:hypothetical protein